MDNRKIPLLRVVADVDSEAVIERFSTGAGFKATSSYSWGTSVEAYDASEFYPDMQIYLADLSFDKWRLSNLLRGATFPLPHRRIERWSIMPPLTYYDVAESLRVELKGLQKQLQQKAEKQLADKATADERLRQHQAKISAGTRSPVDVVRTNRSSTNYTPPNEPSTHVHIHKKKNHP